MAELSRVETLSHSHKKASWLWFGWSLAPSWPITSNMLPSAPPVVCTRRHRCAHRLTLSPSRMCISLATHWQLMILSNGDRIIYLLQLATLSATNRTGNYSHLAHCPATQSIKKLNVSMESMARFAWQLSSDK